MGGHINIELSRFQIQGNSIENRYSWQQTAYIKSCRCPGTFLHVLRMIYSLVLSKLLGFGFNIPLKISRIFESLPEATCNMLIKKN